MELEVPHFWTNFSGQQLPAQQAVAWRALLDWSLHLSHFCFVAFCQISLDPFDLEEELKADSTSGHPSVPDAHPTAPWWSTSRSNPESGLDIYWNWWGMSCCMIYIYKYIYILWYICGTNQLSVVSTGKVPRISQLPCNATILRSSLMVFEWHASNEICIVNLLHKGYKCTENWELAVWCTYRIRLKFRVGLGRTYWTDTSRQIPTQNDLTDYIE